MSRTKQTPKRKHRAYAVPLLGAAGLSGRPTLANACRKIFRIGSALAQGAGVEPVSHEAEVFVLSNLRPGKDRVIIPVRHVLAKLEQPVDDGLLEVCTNGKEIGDDLLGEFRPHFEGVLHHKLPVRIDMLQPQRGDRIVPHTRRGGEGDDRSVAAFDKRIGRHGKDRLADLVQGGDRLRPGCLAALTSLSERLRSRCPCV
jgi:hypothetical protein